MAFLQQLINGLSIGSIYALVALGYTMVYGIIGLINFAHGDIYMVGAFVGYYLVVHVGLGVFPSLILAMLFTALLGMLIEKVAYKPLRGSSRISALITALGVSYLLQNVMILIAGSDVRSFPTNLPVYTYQIAGVQITSIQILIFVVSILLMIALQLIVQKTKMGKAMRATATDANAARLMGINVDHVISFTFALGSALAGAAGVLVGIYYNSISPMMGTAPGLKAFVAAVLGGIGSIPGAMLGGFIIGIIETIVSALGGSTIKDAAVYLVLIIILLVRPSGILGKKNKEKV